MMSSYHVVSTFPLTQTEFRNTVEETENEPRIEYPTLGGIFCQTKYVWLANGRHLEIYSTQTRRKVSEWTFGLLLKDRTARVACVQEIVRAKKEVPLLAIGLDSDFSDGFVCIFNIVGSIMLRVIQVKNKISSIQVVDVGSDMPMPGHLRTFDGVLAVGTNGGDVLLLDFCEQMIEEVIPGETEMSDELNPSQILVINKGHLNRIEHYKEKCVRNNAHLTFHLNAVIDSVSPHFILKRPNGSNQLYVNKAEVNVSALYYCPQLGSLLVGLNFGVFQIWDLMKMELVYTSPVFEDNTPVSHFAIQEPSDDPKAYCYIWVVYSNTGPFHKSFPLAVLYSLKYNFKESHEGYGCIYQEFGSCTVRFQLDMTVMDERRPILKPKGGHCINVTTVNRSHVSQITSLENNEDLSLCYFVWSVWGSDQETYTYQSVFDLNQWYKAYMPTSSNCDGSDNFMTCKCLTDIVSVAGQPRTPFLDSQIKPSTLSQFIGVQRLEEHYVLSSLSYKFLVLRTSNVVSVNVSGCQRSFLQKLESTGPIALLKPEEGYHAAVNLGLIPLYVEVSAHLIPPLGDQRKLLLSIALEERLIGWLCRCAKDWSNGSFSSTGCTLDFLLSWAWERAAVLKNNADQICVTLFDHSDVKLDANGQRCLNSCAIQLKNIYTFYMYVLDKFIVFLSNADVVLQRRNTLHMVYVYFEVLQWLLNVHLLPECCRSDSDSVSVPYPVDELTDYYNKRRSDLRFTSKNKFSTNGSLLFIDNLMDLDCGGPALQRLWTEDGGTGLYPPPSLQALLHTFLVDNVDLNYKLSLVVYVFLDLAMILHQDRYGSTVTQLIKFPAVFKMSSSAIKITQAFWQLDHEDFSTAMEHLLDPLVSSKDFKPWHHRLVLRALLTQEQFKFAVLYMQIRQPSMSEEEDILLVLNIFISNDMVDEALYFERRNRNKAKDNNFLKFLFRECDNQHKLSEIIGKNFSTEEEAVFLNYMDDVRHPNSNELKVFFSIQRSRYLEAFAINDKVHREYASQGLYGQANAKFCDFMAKCYQKLLPNVSQNLVRVCQKEKINWKQYEKPQPTSVVIHRANQQVTYRSTSINAELLRHAKDTWSQMNAQNSFYPDNFTTEDTPFLRTPKISKAKKRMLTPLIQPKIISSPFIEHEGPSPPKRQKIGEPKRLSNKTEMVKLNTPLVKRKINLESSRASTSRYGVCTPQSILKMRNLVRNTESPARQIRGESTTPEDLEQENEEGTTEFDVFSSQKKFNYGLTPRRALERNVRHGVTFEDFRPKFKSSFDSDLSDGQPLRAISDAIPTTKKYISDSGLSSKNTTASVSDIEKFYSPDASTSLEMGVGESERDEKLPAERAKTEPLVNIENMSKEEISEASLRVESPKKRRSIRSVESSPIRSSPRLKSLSSEIKSREVLPSPKSRVSGIKGRKSLQQQVVTNNAFASMVSSAEKPVSKIETPTKTGEDEHSCVSANDISSDFSFKGVELSDSWFVTSEDNDSDHSKLKETGSILEIGESNSPEVRRVETGKKKPSISILSERKVRLSLKSRDPIHSFTSLDEISSDFSNAKDLSDMTWRHYESDEDSSNETEQKDELSTNLETAGKTQASTPLPDTPVEIANVDNQENIDEDVREESVLEQDEVVADAQERQKSVDEKLDETVLDDNEVVVADIQEKETSVDEKIDESNVSSDLSSFFKGPDISDTWLKTDESESEEENSDNTQGNNQVSDVKYRSFDWYMGAENKQNRDTSVDQKHDEMMQVDDVERPSTSDPVMTSYDTHDVINLSKGFGEDAAEACEENEYYSITYDELQGMEGVEVSEVAGEEELPYDDGFIQESSNFTRRSDGPTEDTGPIELIEIEDSSEEENAVQHSVSESSKSSEETGESSDNDIGDGNVSVDEEDNLDQAVCLYSEESDVEGGDASANEEDNLNQAVLLYSEDSSNDAKVEDSRKLIKEDRMSNKLNNEDQDDQSTDEEGYGDSYEQEQEMYRLSKDDNNSSGEDDKSSKKKDNCFAEEKEKINEFDIAVQEAEPDEAIEEREEEHLGVYEVLESNVTKDESPEKKSQAETKDFQKALIDIEGKEEEIGMDIEDAAVNTTSETPDQNNAMVTTEKEPQYEAEAKDFQKVPTDVEGKQEESKMYIEDAAVNITSERPDQNSTLITKGSTELNVDSPVRITRAALRRSLESPVSSTSVKTVPALSLRLRSRSMNEDDVPKEPPLKQAMRKRSASLDQAPTSRKRKSPNTKSEEIRSTPRTRTRRVASTSQLPVIEEESKTIAEDTQSTPKAVKQRSRAKSTSDAVHTMEDYLSTRRLTRRQKSLLEKTLNLPGISENLEEVCSEESEDEERGPKIDKIDPLNLLDKSPFEGQPDPEEQKIYNKSPSSSISGLSTSSKQLSKNSPKSDAHSETSSAPKRRGRSSTVLFSSESSSKEVKGRLRSASIDEEKVPDRKTRTVSQSSEVSEPASRATRSRTKSISSVKSETIEKTPTKRGARRYSVTGELTTILEETPTKKSSRTRKSTSSSVNKE